MPVSYDLAVREGPRTADAAADDRYEQIVAELESGQTQPPTPAIRAYVDALLERWPDITGDDGEDSPWADGPLIGNANGSFIYFAMVWSRCEEASEFAARTAAAHGLVCYDPQSQSQSQTLRPDPAARPRRRGLFRRT